MVRASPGGRFSSQEYSTMKLFLSVVFGSCEFTVKSLERMSFFISTVAVTGVFPSFVFDIVVVFITNPLDVSNVESLSFSRYSMLLSISVSEPSAFGVAVSMYEPAAALSESSLLS